MIRSKLYSLIVGCVAVFVLASNAKMTGAVRMVLELFNYLFLFLVSVYRVASHH